MQFCLQLTNYLNSLKKMDEEYKSSEDEMINVENIINDLRKYHLGNSERIFYLINNLIDFISIKNNSVKIIIKTPLVFNTWINEKYFFDLLMWYYEKSQGERVIASITCIEEESPSTFGLGYRLTAGQGNLTESATEKNRLIFILLGKGEKVR